MEMVLSVLAVAYAALTLWLSVRIFNRRERWAKRIAAALVIPPVCFVLSFGPACWIVSRSRDANMPAAYQLFWYPIAVGGPITTISRWYAGIGMPESGRVNFRGPNDPEGTGVAIIVYDGRAERHIYQHGSTPAPTISVNPLGPDSDETSDPD